MKIFDDYYKKIRKKRQKISFTGTHCVGKSTIIENLKSKSWCNIVPECYRETAEIFGLLCNGDTKKQCYDATLHCFHLQMQKEIELKKKTFQHIICDRTVLDTFLYLEVGNGEKRINYKLYNDLRKVAVNYLKTYDTIYFIKYEGFKLIDDGFRNIDTDMQIKVNEYFVKNFEKLDNVKFISYRDGLELKPLLKVEY